MLTRLIAAASLRRRSSSSSGVPAISSALLGDVLPPLQWDRFFSSETPPGGDQGKLIVFVGEKTADDNVSGGRLSLTSSRSPPRFR